jgi:hypothetical protein
MKSRSRPALLFALGITLVGLLAIGLAAWLYAGPASAHPGNLCEPEPGHGTPDCHVSATETTAPPKATSTESTESTAAPTSTTGVVPFSGPASPPDPSAVQMFVDESNCLSCHGDLSLSNLLTREQPDGSTIVLYVDIQGSANSVHRYQDCTACHTSEPHEIDTPLSKLSLSEKCGTCHEYQYAQHKESVHGVPLQSGNPDPATCTDCHSVNSDPHNVVRVMDPIASAYPKNVADTCAKCHDDSSLMDKYGIVEKVYASYMRSFHGKTIKLAPEGAPIRQLQEATCVSCHGAHNITSASDPDAPVAGMDNLLATCQSCHPDAQPEFVNGFLGHKAVNSDFLPQVYWGGGSFYVFSRAMLAGGALLVATSIGLRGLPWISRRIKRRKKED